MKTMRGKHILTACLTAILLISALSVLALPTGAASYVKSIQNATGTRSAESIYAPFSYRVNVLGEFTAFGFAMPTWTRDDSVCRLSLYLWSGTYEDTLKQEPIATKVFDPMRDNATNTVTFDPQPAGEYLFHVSEPQGSVGVWANVNPTDSLGYAYKDGTESKSLEPELHITFTENLNEPFGACEPSVPPVDGNHTAPAEYVIPEDSKIYTHEVMPDTWVFTDGLGRVSLTNAEVGDPRTDRTLALFYWTWHGFLRTGNPFNNQKFLEENPDFPFVALESRCTAGLRSSGLAGLRIRALLESACLRLLQDHRYMGSAAAGGNACQCGRGYDFHRQHQRDSDLARLLPPADADVVGCHGRRCPDA